MKHLILPMIFAFFLPTQGVAAGVDHSDFDKLLKVYVDKQGRVDYAGLKANAGDREKLLRYLDSIAGAKTSPMTKKQALAFYLNAYNAIVIHSVLQHLPTKSVMDVEGFFKQKQHSVAGRRVTLDELENQIIRKEFAEPRIHFVLVCAAQSCPRLRRSALTAKNLEQILQSSAREFIAENTTLSAQGVSTSKLFEWFAQDFVRAEGSVGAYLAKYLPQHAPTLNSPKLLLTYKEYSWALNRQ